MTSADVSNNLDKTRGSSKCQSLTSSGYTDTCKNGLALKRFNFNLKSTLKETRNTSQLRPLNSDFFCKLSLIFKKISERFLSN